jgi:serine/threonine protein kinase
MAESSSDRNEQDSKIAVRPERDSTATKFCITCNNTFSDEVVQCPNDRSHLVKIEDDPLIGTQVGNHKILSVLGQGGMGVVYKAEHLVMQRIDALKMIRSGSMDSRVILRFQREAQTVSTLKHPNIITVYDCQVSEAGMPYLVMEYIEGRTLTDEQLHLSVEQAVEVFIRLSDALAHAHGKGVIHRDLKPGNIMFADSYNGISPDKVKILDFGIAKVLPSFGKQQLDLTNTGQPIGSPPYMSPEQCRAEELDARSDIYSLGCVMYKVLTGKPTFDSDSLFAVMNQHMHEAPAPFSKVNPELHIPMQLEEVIFKTLEKDPAHRFQSMTELKEALESVRDGVPPGLPLFVSRIRRKLSNRRTQAIIYLLFLMFGVLSLFAIFDILPMLSIRLDKVTKLNDQAHEKLLRGDYVGASKLLDDVRKLESRLPQGVDQNIERARTLELMGCVDDQTGNPARAEKELTESLNLHTLTPAWLALAEACRLQKKFEPAKEALERAKAATLQHEGRDSVTYSTYLMNLGCLQEDEGQNDLARSSYLESLKIRQRQFGKTHMQCRVLYQSLARVCQTLGDTKAAADWDEKAKSCK